MSNRIRREELTIAEKVNAHLSSMVILIESIAAEPQWTNDQRLAIRLVAGRVGQRSFGGFLAERAKAAEDAKRRELIQQLAVRIALLKTPPGELPVLLIDEHISVASRALAMKR